MLSNDIHRFTECPFQLGFLCCLLLLLEICLKTSILWKSHFRCKLIPGHVFFLLVCLPKTILSFSANSFSFESLSFSSHNTHKHMHICKIHISTSVISYFFSKLSKGSPFSPCINLGTLLSFYSSLKLLSLTIHDWNYTKYPYSILHKLSSRFDTIELTLHLAMEIFGLHCCAILAFFKEHNAPMIHVHPVCTFHQFIWFMKLIYPYFLHI